MKTTSYYIVNGITLYRIVTVPLLLVLIFLHKPDVFKWLLACSFFTDAIDGFLARKFKVTSRAGSKLDSIGDDLTVFVGLVGIVVFKPDFIRKEMVLISFLVAMFIAQIFFALLKYRKTTTFHTYAAKISAILQGSFLILLFFLPDPLYVLFYVAAFFTALDLVEEMILVYLLPKPESNVKGLYWVLSKKKKFRGLSHR